MEGQIEEGKQKKHSRTNNDLQKSIAYNYTVTCIMCAVRYIMQDILTGVLSHLWLLDGYF